MHENSIPNAACCRELDYTPFSRLEFVNSGVQLDTDAFSAWAGVGPFPSVAGVVASPVLPS